MPYPKDSYISIVINSKEIGPKNSEAVQKVNCSSNLQLSVSCSFSSLDKIKISGMFVDDLVENTYITFLITNFFIDVVKPLTTESWKVTVFNKDNYFIDDITGGL
jgi:hypothetical protein